MLLWVHAVEKVCLVQNLLDDKREEAAEAASWWLRYLLKPAPFQEQVAAAVSCISFSTDGIRAGTSWLLSQPLFHFARQPPPPARPLLCLAEHILFSLCLSDNVTDAYMRARARTHACSHAFTWCTRVHNLAHKHLSLQCFTSRHLMLQDAFRHWQSAGESRSQCVSEEVGRSEGEWVGESRARSLFLSLSPPPFPASLSLAFNTPIYDRNPHYLYVYTILLYICT
jgi:hypothetical protein